MLLKTPVGFGFNTERDATNFRSFVTVLFCSERTYPFHSALFLMDMRGSTWTSYFTRELKELLKLLPTHLLSIVELITKIIHRLERVGDESILVFERKRRERPTLHDNFGFLRQVASYYELFQTVEHDEIRVIVVPDAAQSAWFVTGITLRDIAKRRIRPTRTIDTFAMRTRERSSHQRKRSDTGKSSHGFCLKKRPSFQKNIDISWDSLQIIFFHQTDFKF